MNMIKKLILTVSVMVALLISNCANEVPLDVPDFESIESVNNWVASHIPQEDREDLENWQDPEETLSRGTGVCSDRSLLFLRIVHEQFNIRGVVVPIDSPKSVVGKHAVARINGIYYDPSFNRIYTDYPYKEYMGLPVEYYAAMTYAYSMPASN